VTRNGRTLYVDAHDWASRVTEVALHAQGAHDHFLRIEAVRTYQPPSMVWETTIDQDEVVESAEVEESADEEADGQEADTAQSQFEDDKTEEDDE
jgi:hypothetical protein